MSRTDRIALTALLIVVALAFGRSLGFGFVYDDYPVILQNPTFGAPGLLHRVLAENVWSFAPDVAEPRYYRPLFTAWLHGTWALVGLDPRGWHASVLLLHLGAVAAIFTFWRRYTGSTTVAALGTLLFAVHPTRAESVAWVLGSTDPLAALFGFSAMSLLLRARPELGAVATAPSRRAEWGAAALFALALLSKETALVFACAPVGLALFGPIRQTPRAQRLRLALRLGAPWLGIVGLYLLARGQVIGALSPSYQDLPWLDQLRTQAVLVGTYLEHLLLPGRLSLATPVSVVRAWGDPALLEALPGLLILSPLLLGAALLGGRARLPLWLGIGFLLPVLRVNSLQPDMMFQDRYLYLPSACWLPALLWGMARARDVAGLPDIAVPAVGGLSALIFLGSLQANLEPWRSNRALWQRAVEVDPQSGRAWFNLGTERENGGDIEGAEAAYLRAVQEEPNRALFHFRLGYMFAQRQQLQDARVAFERAVALRPGDPMMLYEAGRIDRFLGEAARARALLDAAAAAVDAGAPIAGGITRGDIERERAALGPAEPGG